MRGAASTVSAIALHLGLCSAAANACTKPKYSAYLPILSGFKQAVSWCSTNYPIAPVATTTTLQNSAKTTVTDTTITTHVTNTHTEKSTTVITTTETVSANKKRSLPTTLQKRAANPTKVALSSLKTANAAIAKTVCSCIETPSTTTLTKTAQSINTVHTTAISTVQHDETTTVIETSTTTTTSTQDEQPTCTETTCYNGFQIYKGCAYASTPQGNGVPRGAPQNNLEDCIDACAKQEDCIYTDYGGGYAGECELYTTVYDYTLVNTGLDTAVKGHGCEEPEPEPEPTCTETTCYNGFTIHKGCVYQSTPQGYGVPKGAPQNGLEDCIDACAKSPGCIYADFGGGYEGECELYNTVNDYTLVDIGRDSASKGC